jgi:hypothetical protein
MPITPFLRNEAFDPDLIDTMSAALTQACTTLGLVDRADPITEVVAHHIIKLAQRGIRTQTALYLATIEEFKANAQ